MKVKLEYIWLDGHTPEPNLRSKTKVWEWDPKNPKFTHLKRTNGPHPDELPIWSFDGSSTKQADSSNSDCLLKPVRVIVDIDRVQSFLVLCEVLNVDGTPHISNTRHLINDEYDSSENGCWFGFEQEYTLFKDCRILGFPEVGLPKPQGDYYCGLGNGNVIGREIAEKHLNLCLSSGLQITGINAEVLLGQWEYQLFGNGAKATSDDLWLSRFILIRLCETYNIEVSFHPKPIEGDWNGSGLHVNFSNRIMREEKSETNFTKILTHLKYRHLEFIENYGSKNEMRLTGKHETQTIDKFSWGVSDRGASIRIPHTVIENDWSGYLEDRRPGANADPYKITKLLTEVLHEATNEVTTI